MRFRGPILRHLETCAPDPVIPIEVREPVKAREGPVPWGGAEALEERVRRVHDGASPASESAVLRRSTYGST